MSAILEAGATTAGLYVARWLDPRAKKAMSEAIDDLKSINPIAYKTLLYGWKTDSGFRDTIDRNTILTATGINALAGKITPHLGILAGSVNEVVERVVSAVPDLLPEVLNPLAEKFMPEPGTPAPNRAATSAAMKAYLDVFAQKLPHHLMIHLSPFNPSRWFTKPGEVLQQATNAVGPLGMLAMSIFWMDNDAQGRPILTDAEREEYAYCFFALNTPEEVENFFGLPNDDSRKLWLKFVNFARQNRFIMSPADRQRLFAMIHELYRDQVAPLLVSTTGALRELRNKWRREHRALFQPPEPRPNPVLTRFPRLAEVPLFGWVIVAGILLIVAVAISNLAYPS